MLISPIGPQFFNNDGTLAAGCKLYTYVTGTTTPLTAYQTQNGTAHTNPITLDSAGKVQPALWLNIGSEYRLRLETAAGSLIDEWDDIYGADTRDTTGNVVRLGASVFSAAILQAAYDELATAGGGVIELASGTYDFDSYVTPKNHVTLRGAGMGETILRQTVTATRLFTRSGSFSDQLDYLAFENFTAYGMWEGNQTMGGDDDRHISIAGCKRIVVRNVESVYCRQMGISIGFSNEVLVTGCRVRLCARDGINLTGSRKCVVTDNFLSGIGDDAIAIHQNGSAGNPPIEGHVISGNSIEDAGGVKVLGASKTAISGNSLRRVKGYGIVVRRDGTEGYSDSVAVSITGNSITDIINANKFGGGNLCVGIIIGSSTKSYQEPVVGGETPDINYPESFYYLSNHSTNQNAGGHGIVVSGNTINGFTLPAVAAYSTWGFGSAFDSEGLEDPDLSTGYEFAAFGIRLEGALLSVSIQGNTIIGTANPITLDSGITALKLLTVQNNTITRYSGHGVALETSATKHGKAIVEGNFFDADPYFESANRTAGPDGTWSTGAQAPTAIDAVNWKGAQLLHNTFRNLNQVHHSNGNTLLSNGPNVYIMEPNSAATLQTSSASNKGIRRPDGLEAPGSLLVWEDSDPTSATYGQELGRNNLAASAMPTAGYYIAGQFVSNIAFATANQTLEAGTTDPTPQYTILGWKRLTTSSAHVLNTDWREMRCLTGN